MNLSLKHRSEDGWTVVEVVGEVDVFSAPALRAQLATLISEGHTRMVVDLSGVPFMDSTGLGVLVGRLKTIRQQQGELRLVITGDRLLRNFSITGLDKVFMIGDSVASATKDHA